jgi:hypothetical protein
MQEAGRHASAQRLNLRGVRDVYQIQSGSVPTSTFQTHPLSRAELLAKRGVIEIWRETGLYRLKPQK